ncbi:T9SS type A sorting domain-containing protein [uncultured Polaribacter sp.]|uniref:T9SS type A sorting domain-containing protein n=1 Tax=uncultured Polaribacter sp. TaxID=174711 RepID=UPI0026038C60|nr:T9SS type A sorting domain-containing protein [uncultured Polaribacter sp.]
MVVSMTTFAQTTSIPDENFEGALINLGIDMDGVLNGQITTADAANVTGTLDLDDLEINDLTGIEAFVNIDRLNCEGNLISTVDLSSNTSLEIIRLHDNLNLVSINISNLLTLEELYLQNTSLTVLDASSCPSLRYIYAGGNSLLTSINTTGLTSLTRLYVNGTALSTIDVSTNTSLERFLVNDTDKLAILDLSNNGSLQRLVANNTSLHAVNLKNGNNTTMETSTSRFNLQNNPNLLCVEIDDAFDATTIWSDNVDDTGVFRTSCYTSSLQDLVLITDGAFKTALINLLVDTNGDGNIQTSEAEALTGVLDVDNKGISNLAGIASFVNITTLHCRENSISNLDLTSNLELEEVRIDENGMQSVELTGLTKLERFYSTTNNLNTLDFTGCTDLMRIYSGDNPNLSTVVITDLNNIDYLYVNGSNFSEIDVSGVSSLTRLRVEDNANLTSINTEGLTNLDLIWCNNTSLATLDLRTNTKLTRLRAQNNENLVAVNLKNTNNSKVTSDFNLTGNPSLTCVEIDDGFDAINTWSPYVDNTVVFNTFCYETATATINVHNNPIALNYSISPNPVQNVFTLYVTLGGTYSIGNLAGQLMIENRELLAGANEISIGQLADGIYFINIYDTAGRHFSSKIIKN